MKDWLGIYYPSKFATYDQLRQQLKEAWDTIGSDLLDELIRPMHERCEDVTNAEGGHAKW